MKGRKSPSTREGITNTVNIFKYGLENLRNDTVKEIKCQIKMLSFNICDWHVSTDTEFNGIVNKEHQYFKSEKNDPITNVQEPFFSTL